jgi:hypothetical protein
MKKTAVALTAGLLFGPALFISSARAEDDAKSLLKAMTDYIAAQKTLSATIDSDIEVVTPDLQKIQFTSSGRVLLNRPDKFRVSRTGGYADLELVFDGKTATLLGKGENAYASVEIPGTFDQFVGKLRNEHNMAMPGADLLVSGSYDDLMNGVYDAKHIGRGVIDGVECEHLAFRAADTDWQIWIEPGARPIPHKYVITSKAVTGAPQYTLRIREFRTDAPVAADAFSFTPPAGSKKVAVADLRHLDEVPQGEAPGAKK